MLEVNRQCMADIHQTAEITRGAGQAAEQADAYFVRKRDEIGESGSIIEIDAKESSDDGISGQSFARHGKTSPKF